MSGCDATDLAGSVVHEQTTHLAHQNHSFSGEECGYCLLKSSVLALQVQEFYASRGTVVIDESWDQDTTDLAKCCTWVSQHWSKEQPSSEARWQVVVAGGALMGTPLLEIGSCSLTLSV